MSDQMRQAALFGDDHGLRPMDAEDHTARARRQNAERQRRWRARHTQFFVPIIESPDGRTYFVEALSTQ
jgi:hypothetical protein